jgi:hypothetical protein
VRLAVGGLEDPSRLRVALPPPLECAHDVCAEIPSAGIVRLVLVERDDAEVEVDVRPLEPDGLTQTRAFAVAEREHHAIEDRRLAPAHPRLLGRPELPLRERAPRLGHVLADDGVAIDLPERVYPVRQQLADRLDVLPPRCRLQVRRQGRHDGVDVFDADLGEEEVAELHAAACVRFVHHVEGVLVALRRALGLHVVREALGERARRPRLRNVAEALCPLRRGKVLEPHPAAGAEPTYSVDDDSEHDVARRSRFADGLLDVPLDRLAQGLVGVRDGAEVADELGDHAAALLGLGLRLRVLEEPRHALAAAEAHADEPAAACLVDVAGGIRRHPSFLSPSGALCSPPNRAPGSHRPQSGTVEAAR